MLQTFHLDPKESNQLVENGHPMTPLISFVFVILSYQNACYGCENAENRTWSEFFMMDESFGGSA